MISDIQRIVAAGHDDVADDDLKQFGISAVRQKWLRRLMDGLPGSGSRVLCDAGLRVRHSSIEKQDNEDATFMWIEALKSR